MRSLGANDLIIDTYLLDHNRRRLCVCFYSFRVDHRDALDGREPELSVTTFPSGRIAAAAALARHHAVCSAVSNRRDRGNRSVGKLVELFFANVKDAFAATQPQVVSAVFQNAVDNIVKQAIARRVGGKLVRLSGDSNHRHSCQSRACRPNLHRVR